MQQAIQTAALAQRIGYKSASIRTHVWRHGHFMGIKPTKGKRPKIAVLQVIQQSGLISSVNSPSSHARAMAASRRVSSW